MTDREAASPAVDPLARLLEIGLAVVIVGAPLPLAAVGPRGRLALELTAFVLGLIWLIRGMRLSNRLPSLLVRIGMLGSLLLGTLQLVPLPPSVVRTVSPETHALRLASHSPPEAAAAEERLLGIDPATLEDTPRLSVDPPSTASALRTGTALALLFVVATTVAAVCGVRRLALAFLISAGFQALYGLLVLASGYDRIWHLPKLHYLESATGTFVNRNHFACFLAISLAVGLALILGGPRVAARRTVWHDWLGPDGGRRLLGALVLLIGIAGLLASFSRAGITLGLLALVLTLAGVRRAGGLRLRWVIVLLLLAVAAVPLAQLGADRLVARYADSAEHFTGAGGRGQVWGDSLVMARSNAMVGTGYGTFAVAYPLYRSPEVRMFYAHAHNDLVQLAAEGGLIGLALFALIALPVLRGIVLGLSGAKGTLAVGLAAGLTAVLLHGLVDFNFHIPANAAAAAILAGALQGLPCRIG